MHGKKKHQKNIHEWKRKGKRSLERPSQKWKDNIKMNFKYGWNVWTGFIWLRTLTSFRSLLSTTVKNLGP